MNVFGAVVPYSVDYWADIIVYIVLTRRNDRHMLS